MKVKVKMFVVSDSLLSHGLSPARLLCPWDFPGKNIGVGCYFLPQGIFLTRGIKPGSLALAGRFFTTESPGKPNMLHDPEQVIPLLFPDAQHEGVSWMTLRGPLTLLR